MKVFNGIDNIEEYDNIFKNKNIGLITNPTGIDRNFRSTIDIFNERYNLKALYSPEHGVRGNLADGALIENYNDAETGVPVFSLYRPGSRRFSEEMLDGIDMVVYDIQDVGMRYYTYIYTMLYAMEDCAARGIEFAVLDRVNPLGGEIVEGNILEESCKSFVGDYEMCTRYGLTPGEFSIMANKEKHIGCKLFVVPLKGWKRSMLFEETGLEWITPSPNLPTPVSSLCYAGTCFFEGTNLSEGRGTTHPFELIGAPFIKPAQLAEAMNNKRLEGVYFRPCYMQPMFSKHQGKQCGAVQIHISDKKRVKPLKMGVELLYEIRLNYEEFEFRLPNREAENAGVDLLSGSRMIRENLDVSVILAKYKQDEKLFAEKKKEFHLY